MRLPDAVRSPDETGAGLGGMPPADPQPNTSDLPPAAPRRAGSVTLREGPGPMGQAGIDPANQSLADALRVMLRVLQAGMVVLGILYVLSGMQKVNEGERGIRLLFGREMESGLEPGFHWSAPYPLGELVRVKQGYQDVDISKDFWIDVPAGQVNTSIEKLQGTPSLKPDQNGSGSVITADGNIAHTRWRASFRRDDVSKFYRRILEEDELAIVRAEIKRAVVQAVAEVTLTDLLQQTSQKGSTVPKRAQLIAQDSLERLGSGLVITALTMDPPIPPLYAKDAFNRASAASTQANKDIQDAQSYRGERLNKIAGDMAPYLIYYIDQYEGALARAEAEQEARPAGTVQDPAAAQAASAQADEIVATIDALMLGREDVQVPVMGDDGKPERGADNKPTGRMRTLRSSAKGEVAAILSDASLYRTGVRSRAQTTLSRYEAKLAQFRVNPTVMLQNEWTTAMRSFMSKDTFEYMLVPQGTGTLALLLNSDPDYERDTMKAIKEKQRLETERLRNEELMKRGRETETGGLGLRE